ncbi:class I SAM-dependent methyltransferase [Xanthobacter sp. DSM 24535]|uniref:hypothetical protein n=1 Tax=Roseixanthobacter psychrophilus TaxID=3119917 RepID=UPI0037276382
MSLVPPVTAGSPNRVEFLNPYYDLATIAEAVRLGAHRSVIGGLWDEIGTLQRDFLLGQGLQAHHRLADIGCGSLRSGVCLVPVLNAGNYFGIDLNESLLDAGWTQEIVPLGLDGKLPRANLNVSDDFDLAPFGVQFDMGIAQSVFTHLPLRFLSQCLERTAPYFRPAARLYATYFEVSEEGFDGPFHHDPGGVVTFSSHDPYHYTRDQIFHACGGAEGWDLEFYGDWGHPRSQKMLVFTRRQQTECF